MVDVTDDLIEDQNPNDYWASADSDELAATMMDKVKDYYDFLRETGRDGLYRQSYNSYYRGS